MASKDHYKIPASIDRSYLDHEINLSTRGWTLPTLPLKVILIWVSSTVVMFWAVTHTFVASADLWLKALFCVLWLALTAFLGRYDKTREMTYTKVKAFLSYAPKSARNVLTRRNANPSAFYDIARIASISDDGLIEWADGTIGQVYLVVGSASVLVFEEDKRAILNRVDSFFRKIDTTAEFIFVTTKEPQRVYRQLARLDDINLKLEDRDPELIELMNERLDILRDYVGTSFISIHQYLVIKADNLDALRRAHTVLAAESEESNLMIKQITMLDGRNAESLLSTLYKGVDSR